MKLFLRILFIIPIIFVLNNGCSDSSDPISNNNNSDTDTITADFPDIPAPICSNCNIPDVSDTLTVIKPLTGDSVTTFAPMVNKVLADWAFRLNNICYVDECSEKCIIQDSLSPYLNTWSNDTTLYFNMPGWREDPEIYNDLLFTCVTPFGEHNLVSPAMTSISLNNFPQSITFLDEGNASSNIIDSFVSIIDLPGDGDLVLSRSLEFDVIMIAYGLTNPLYLRRDRYWVRLPIDGQSGGSIELTNGQTKSLTSTYSQGTSSTEAEEFSSTFNISGPGYLSGISASLSQTFSTSTTVSSWNSTSVTYTISGELNKTIIATVWAIVEEYTFCDVDGNPYVDPNWDLELPKLVLENTKERLETWEF